MILFDDLMLGRLASMVITYADRVDDLDAEIKKKIKRGYRLTNIIFEDTREGRLAGWPQAGVLD